MTLDGSGPEKIDSFQRAAGCLIESLYEQDKTQRVTTLVEKGDVVGYFGDAEYFPPYRTDDLQPFVGIG
ncbi:hypothetical protein SAMN05661093_01913 [Kibdelosporangium aridum]|uniref:Uncharacterized protein n=1 Tax=Kibdelosporangium aridum TaxID=2030 RepID=A0A1Y5X6Z7_KIBAR|nr:hypothetical protein SAMN05661093_01913 [Kibdelosporangium aridum]